MIDYKKENAEIVVIGANEARYLLDLNIKNRKPRNSVVAQYLNEIKNDKFKFNGSSIVVSENGVLLDGQHRLMALEKAINKTIKTVLVTGIKDETMETIDTGSKRTAGDVMTLNGVKNANSIACIVKNVLDEISLNRKLEYGIRTKNGILSKDKLVISYTNDEVYDEYMKHKQMYDEATEFGSHLYLNGVKIKGLSASLYGAYYILFSRENKQEAKNFLREISSGIRHRECNTAISLREKLINNTIKKINMSAQELRDMMIYYFRKYKDNKEVVKYLRSPMAFQKEDLQC